MIKNTMQWILIMRIHNLLKLYTHAHDIIEQIASISRKILKNFFLFEYLPMTLSVFSFFLFCHKSKMFSKCLFYFDCLFKLVAGSNWKWTNTCCSCQIDCNRLCVFVCERALMFNSNWDIWFSGKIPKAFSIRLSLSINS